MIPVNSERLWKRLHTIGALGADPAGGISRFPWTEDYRQAMKRIIEYGSEAGLSARVDPVGNLFLRLTGSDPNAQMLLSGSHLDTVPSGGYFDGLAGIMAALESLVSIKESGITPRCSIELVAFVNEEGSSFPGGTFGSRAMCGMLPEQYLDNVKHRYTGQTMRQAIREFGMGTDPAKFLETVLNPVQYKGFFEVHIEQGRCLLDAGLPLAVVNDIAGIRQFYIDIQGIAAHAGGMAMKDRHDALMAGAHIACEAERLALDIGRDTRITVGFMDAKPGEHNIIAEKCTVPIDYREAGDAAFEKLYDDIMAYTHRICEQRGLNWSVRTTLSSPPAHCDAGFIDRLELHAEELGIPYTQMISYPCHDAVHLSRIMPMSMIFLRSGNDGVSHCPQEYTSREDLAAGTSLLAQVLLDAVQI